MQMVVAYEIVQVGWFIDHQDGFMYFHQPFLSLLPIYAGRSLVACHLFSGHNEPKPDTAYIISMEGE
ncbi:MAG: hypothetical protein ACLR0U_03500 [Enterocloster clostridioformis]